MVFIDIKDLIAIVVLCICVILICIKTYKDKRKND